MDKFGTVEGDRAREKQKAEREGGRVDPEMESPVAMQAVAQDVGLGGGAMSESAGVQELAAIDAAPPPPPMEKRRGKIFGIW